MSIPRQGIGHESSDIWAGLSVSNINTLVLAPARFVLPPGPDPTGFILIVRHRGHKEL